MQHFAVATSCMFCESDSKTGNTVARVYNVALKIVSCNIPLPTVAATKMR